MTCHDGKREGVPALTGEPDGWSCKSFNVLIRHVPYSSWNQQPNNNNEPLTRPLTFGALPSKLLKRLESDTVT